MMPSYKNRINLLRNTSWSNLCCAEFGKKFLDAFTI